MSKATPSSVVIVGAGVAGLCTAYHLAEAGVKRVILVDKQTVGSGSSSRSGAVNTMLMATETATRARGLSMDLFERFGDILDGYSFHQSGCMFICSEDQFRKREEEQDMQRRAGAHFDILRRAEVEERFPDLRIGDDEYCVLDYRGGWNEPETYIRALTARIRQMGVEVRENLAVEEFLIEDGRLSGIRTRTAGEIRADAVVCTVNAWVNSLLQQVGQLMPARNYVYQRFVTPPFAAAPLVPATNDDALGVYYRPTEDHRLLLGSSGPQEAVEIVMPGVDFDYKALELPPVVAPFIKEAVRERLPMMDGVDFAEHRVGLISMTADSMPNVGPVARLPGLFLASNFNSGGFGHHAFAALLLKEFIVDGQTQLDAGEFSPDRFSDFDTESFLAGNTTYGTIRRH